MWRGIPRGGEEWEEGGRGGERGAGRGKLAAPARRVGGGGERAALAALSADLSASPTVTGGGAE